MALLTRLATPLKSFFHMPAITRSLGAAAASADFTKPVNAFVSDAMNSAGLEVHNELDVLENQKVTNMGILKACNLDELGFSVGAKTAIKSALQAETHQNVRKMVGLQREASRVVCRKQRAF